MVADPEGEAGRLLNYLRIDDPKSRQTLITQMREVYSSSVGRWKESLANDEVDVIEKESGHLLNALAYTLGRDGAVRSNSRRPIV